jgi:hypothetical protein
MARDVSVEVRRAIVSRLNDPASRTYAIAAGRAYGPAEPSDPQWPFVRVDLPIIVPDYDGCSDASLCTFRVHGFAVDNDERAAAALGGAIAADLDGMELQLVADPEAYLQDSRWTGTQLLRDTAKEKGWHAAVTMDCKVAA